MLEFFRSFSIRGAARFGVLIVVTGAVTASVIIVFFYPGQQHGPLNRDSNPSVLPDFEATKAIAEAGDPEAAAVLGEIYSEGKQVRQSLTEAAKWYRQAADQGIAMAQRNLAMLYEMGVGVKRRDFPEAAAWYLKAAEQGDTIAQYSLASMYARGRGVTFDGTEALKWYHRAAQQGDSLSRYNLAERYARGRDVSPDPVEAYKWYSLAAEKGLADAAEAKERLERRLTVEQVAEARRRIEEFKAEHERS